MTSALELHIAAINLGIEGIPRDRIRLHVCWGNNDGPHVHDIAMAAILPELYRANVGALSIEFANPRHQHEYDALRISPLPARMLRCALRPPNGRSGWFPDIPERSLPDPHRRPTGLRHIAE